MDTTNNVNPTVIQNPSAPTYAEKLQKLAVDDAYWGGYYKGALKGLATGMIVSGLILAGTVIIASAVKDTKETKEEKKDE